jgi:uncharacterized protein YoxC
MSEPDRPPASAEFHFPSVNLPEPKPQTPPRKRSSLAALIVAVVALAALAAYLWFVNSQWQDQNDRLRDQAAVLSTQVDEIRQANATLESQVEALVEERDGATATVTDLADSQANARDESAFLSEIVDSAFECADAQSNHITHLENSSRYTASSLAAEGRDISEFCSGVNDAYEEYRAKESTN